jgi:hypothetical protein
LKTLNNLERFSADLFSNQCISPKLNRLSVEAGKALLCSPSTTKLTCHRRQVALRKQVWVTLADYLDELDVVVKEAPPTRDVSSAEATETDLDPWMQFFDTLEPVEVEITKIFGYNGQLSETDLDTLARAHTAMGNAVMDSLNEKAQGHLGHLPFYHDGESWQVEEDDLPMLRNFLGVEVN